MNSNRSYTTSNSNSFSNAELATSVNSENTSRVLTKSFNKRRGNLKLIVGATKPIARRIRRRLGIKHNTDDRLSQGCEQPKEKLMDYIDSKMKDSIKMAERLNKTSISASNILVCLKKKTRETEDFE
jgi:hypothetical protein